MEERGREEGQGAGSGGVEGRGREEGQGVGRGGEGTGGDTHSVMSTLSGFLIGGWSVDVCGV